MNFRSEATTKHKDEKKNRSPDSLIRKAIDLSSIFLAHEKHTDAQPAKIAKPALVIEVVSNVGLPKVTRINVAPDIKINTRNVPIIT